MSQHNNLVENATQSSGDPILQWVTFNLDGEVYGVNVMQVQEVLRYTEIAPVPGAPHYVLGIVNLRGNVVTVIDIRLRFGLSSHEISDQTRIIIVEVNKQVIGLLVDSVREVVYLRESEIEPSPNIGTDESSLYFQGVCNRDSDLLILIDINKLFSSQELEDMSLF